MRAELSTQPNCEKCGHPLTDLSAICSHCSSEDSSFQSPPPKTWAQRDAEITGGLTQIARLIFGLFGLVIGCLLIFGSVHISLGIAEKGVFPNTSDAYSWGLFTIVAAVLMAFGLGQVMAVFWVGKDVDQDDRLWVKTNSKERGILQQKRDFSARLVSLFSFVLLLVPLVVQDVILFRPILAGFLAPRWEAFAAVLLTASLLWLLVRSVRHGRFWLGRIGDHVAKQWISQNSWTIRACGTTVGSALFFLALGVVCIGVSLYDLLMHPVTWLRLASLVPGALFLTLPLTERKDILQNFRYGQPKLLLTRDLDEGCIRLSGTVLLRQDQGLDKGTWQGEVTVSDSDDQPLHELRKTFPTASTEERKNRHMLSFNCRIAPPSSLPYNADLTSWYLSFFQSRDKKQKVEFLLPKDVIFLEEIPLK